MNFFRNGKAGFHPNPDPPQARSRETLQALAMSSSCATKKLKVIAIRKEVSLAVICGPPTNVSSFSAPPPPPPPRLSLECYTVDSDDPVCIGTFRCPGRFQTDDGGAGDRDQWPCRPRPSHRPSEAGEAAPRGRARVQPLDFGSASRGLCRGPRLVSSGRPDPHRFRAVHRRRGGRHRDRREGESRDRGQDQSAEVTHPPSAPWPRRRDRTCCRVERWSCPSSHAHSSSQST